MHTQLDGIVVLDKPAGLSSAQTVAKVKKLLGAAKCGHAGTLDPFATGVLVCCINRATRLANFFLHGWKTYEAVLRLGISTDTQDRTGQIVERQPLPQLSEPQLQALFRSFEGPQLQQPPVYSALKHEGTALYKLARKGQPFQKPARPITIERLRILKVCLPDIWFEIGCSAGTYVRTLCADIGQRLECGGHLAELRRTRSSNFSLDNAISLATLQEMVEGQSLAPTLVSMAQALEHIPAHTADAGLLEHIRHGRGLTAAQIPAEFLTKTAQEPTGGWIKVVDHSNQLKAVIQKSAHKDMYNYCCVFH